MTSLFLVHLFLFSTIKIKTNIAKETTVVKKVVASAKSGDQNEETNLTKTITKVLFTKNVMGSLCLCCLSKLLKDS